MAREFRECPNCYEDAGDRMWFSLTIYKCPSCKEFCCDECLEHGHCPNCSGQIQQEDKKGQISKIL